MKKNRKLFAILTLVAFMMTLVPAFAFAAATDYVDGKALAAEKTYDTSGKVKITVEENADIYVVEDGKVDRAATNFFTEGGTNQTTYTSKAAIAKDYQFLLVPTGTTAILDKTVETKDQAKLVLVTKAEADAAIAGGEQAGAIVETASVFGFANANQDIVAETGKAPLSLVWRNVSGRDLPYASETIYVWAEDTQGNPTNALKIDKLSPIQFGKENAYAYKIENASASKVANMNASFVRAGEYTIYATTTELNGTTEQAKEMVKDVVKLQTGNGKVTVSDKAADPEESYRLTVNNKEYSVENEIDLGNVPANGLYGDKVTVRLTSDGKSLVGKEVAIDTNSTNITVNKTKATTNAYGEFDFKVAGEKEGNYEIYVTIDGAEFTFVVKVGNTAAANIDLKNAPDAPVALYGDSADADIRVTFSDINGNKVTDGKEANIAKTAANEGGKYIYFLEKPEGTDLKDTDLHLNTTPNKKGEFTLTFGKTFDKEGTYTVKIALENGRYTTVTFEVKKFDVPVDLVLEYDQTSIELGGVSSQASAKFVDANGVEKDAKAELAATGYAIKSFNDKTGEVTLKNDEKYLGQTITVTAISERYNLTDSVTLTVAEDAQGIKFATDKAVIDNNNKIEFSLVDSNGNVVALGTNATVNSSDITFVVTSKPEGAKVSVSLADEDLATKGKATMNLTSDTEGDVTVQVMVKAKVKDGENTGLTNKYYSGTQTFKVGKEFGEGTVVMTINSATMLVDGELVEIDAPAVIKDNRTFVPFRALSEAFGAQVEYDQATQTVTATLDGKTVVLTIGSTVMTVGDEAVTLDVAPYIANDRTMVPVRAVAEAFGFDVEATFNADGSTAGVVFAR